MNLLFQAQLRLKDFQNATHNMHIEDEATFPSLITISYIVVTFGMNVTRRNKA